MGEWIWDGGRPSLDLVNTLRDRWRDGRELLVDADALVEWLRAAGLLAEGVAAPEHVALARKLREAIDRAVQARVQGRVIDDADVARINDAARSSHHAAAQLRVQPDGSVVAWQPSPPDPVRAALAAVAADAIDLLATEPFPRVAVCAWHRCGVRFLDTSPARNRQWCSMSRCGNRAKARQYYARRKASS
ncbi:hypothetical protein GCM10011581_36120 [Saccharopolyspora subtropica]|uniref:Zinc finger CGNR domain-containing protein n=1 Tax=Saccharopolyspora thermophila TaxID=89367 RepID=A0A917NGD9_9PSEU|nr:ABATE domain-containing protein [Saccharopolyspora subtropica]GGI95751.1 hypothetical protein GCM10011581_36120 [Saccharopolyspora subtropica]